MTDVALDVGTVLKLDVPLDPDAASALEKVESDLELEVSVTNTTVVVD